MSRIWNDIDDSIGETVLEADQDIKRVLRLGESELLDFVDVSTVEAEDGVSIEVSGPRQGDVDAECVKLVEHREGVCSDLTTSLSKC